MGLGGQGALLGKMDHVRCKDKRVSFVHTWSRFDQTLWNIQIKGVQNCNEIQNLRAKFKKPDERNKNKSAFGRSLQVR